MMIGDTQGNRDINRLLPEFSVIVQDIFERTAPLMTIPPTFAKKYNLNIWSEFERSVTRTLEIANEIVDIGLKVNGNGLLKEMQSNKMSTEMIKRIFVDLIIAAGDTVNNRKILCVKLVHQQIHTFLIIDIVHHPMGTIPSKL